MDIDLKLIHTYILKTRTSTETNIAGNGRDVAVGLQIVRKKRHSYTFCTDRQDRVRWFRKGSWHTKWRCKQVRFGQQMSASDES